MSVVGLVGRKLGRYTLTGILGEGGMAVVYRAVDPDERELAIKVLPPWNTGGEAGRTRFTREIEEARKLEHPNLVRVLDAGEEEGILYYCMELVRGQTLDKYLQLEPLPPFDDAVHIIKGICKGLAYLHGRRVVHRDLKPANVFLVGERKDVVLGDFGLLKPLELDTLTPTNERLGTPAYMSPEQFKGVEIDTRSDIYQLGVLLFRLLTGKVPFDDPNFFNLAARHMTKAPPEPRSLNPDIPASLEKVILKCLAKKPADRYEDAAALGRDLNRYLIRKEMAVPGVDPGEAGPQAAPVSDIREPGPARVARPATGLLGWLAELPARLAWRIGCWGLAALFLAPAWVPLSVRLPPETVLAILTVASGALGLALDLLPGRTEARARLAETWVLVLTAWLGVEVSLAPGGRIMDHGALGIALGLQAVLLGVALIQSLGWRAAGPWKALYALSTLQAAAYLVELAYGATPKELVAAEMRVLAGSASAYLTPFAAPLAYARIVHLPLTGVLAIAGGLDAMRAEEPSRALRGAATTVAVLAVLSALVRTVAVAGEGVFGWI